VIEGNGRLQDRQLFRIPAIARTWRGSRKVLRRCTEWPECWASEMLDRGTEADLLGEHYELQDVATHAASEAVPTLGCWIHVQVGAAAIVMKGTATNESPTTRLELNPIPADDLLNRMIAL